MYGKKSGVVGTIEAKSHGVAENEGPLLVAVYQLLGDHFFVLGRVE